MVDMPSCCRHEHDIKKCIKLLHEGIQAQCVGLEDFKEHKICAGKEHTLWGLRKAEEGLHCIDRR